MSKFSRQTKRYFRFYVLFFISVALAFGAGIVLGHGRQQEVRGNLFGKETVADENFYKYYTMFRETYAILQREFVNEEKTDSKTLLSGAIKGMLQATEDPYTDYLTPEIAKEFTANIQASFFGVGIRLEMRDSILTVISALPGTPAAAADVLPNDRIIEIDGKSTKDMTSFEAVGHIRGKLGTTVDLTLSRPGVMRPFTVSLKRAKINIETIESALIESNGKKVGYIKLIEFSEPTTKEFQRTLNEFVNQKADAIVLDVRNNPGGLLTGAAQIADFLLERGLIVYTVGRSGNDSYEFRATGRNLILKPDTPLAVLINQGSASASEIVAGALQDTGRAVVVGKKSFGKGSVQKTRDLPDSSLLKYTVAKYHTPSGRTIEGVGLTPDIEVDMWFDALTEDEKLSVVQLQVTNFVADFLQNTPAPRPADFTNFHSKVNAAGIPLSYDIVSNVVLQRMTVLSPSVYNIDQDVQLRRALDAVTKDYDKYKKTVSYFDTIKTPRDE